MSIETVMPWVQVAAGTMFIGSWYATRRAGGTRGNYAIGAGVMSVAQGVSMLTSGRVRAAAWVVLAVCGLFVTRLFLTIRDRGSLLIGLAGFALILFITVTELLLDDLSGMQKALFATVSVVATTVVVTTTIRLVHAVRTRASGPRTA